MGGKALKTVNTRRFYKDEFYLVRDKVVEILNSISNNSIYPVKSIRDKSSFGDLDILVIRENINKDFIENVKIKFKSNEVKRNDNVVSLNYGKLQVDLIFINKDTLEVAKIFYDYNDCGILVGKLARTIGLCFGPDGLFYEFYYNSTRTKILLSTDIRKILSILNLNYDEFNAGFNKIEDLFLTISKSKYFNMKITKRDFQNSRIFNRDIKRRNILKLIDWMSERTHLIPEKHNKLSQVELIDFCDCEFPESNIKKKIQEIIKNIELNKVIRSKFNGNKVIEITQLQNESIGLVIKDFKSRFKNVDDFNLFILLNSEEKIEEIIKDIAANYIQ